MTLSVGELVARVAIAAALGGLVGLERELSDQPAGFRTHILVSLGAALFTISGAYGLEDFLEGGGITTRLDPTRVAAQVVTGVGFLGAGAIMHRGVNIRGLTTAASLWVTAAIGMAVGFGYWEGAVAVALVALAALYILGYIERGAREKLKRGRVRFVIDSEPQLRLGELTEVLDRAGGRVVSIKVVEEEDEEAREFIVVARLPSHAVAEAVADEIRSLEGVADVDLDL
jgi:putative Mg2+ transporter-C (MgtC) family protein